MAGKKRWPDWNVLTPCGDDRKPRWRCIGAAWDKDGTISISLDLPPQNGRILLVKPDDASTERMRHEQATGDEVPHIADSDVPFR